MIGFAVSTVAVILAAWFGYTAGRAGHPHVPAGTFTPTHTGYCLERTRRTIADTTGWADAPGGQTPERGQRIDSQAARRHVDLDDRIYGRNG